MTNSHAITPPVVSPYLELPPRDEALVRAEREKEEAAVHWRRHLWETVWDEEERLERLISICTRLEDGNEEAGKRLATKAIWTP